MCGGGGGTAKLYALQMDTGFAGVDFTNGTALTSSNSSTARSITIGSGIASMPVIVVSYPSSGSSASVSASAVTATTSQQLPNNKVPPPSSMKNLQYGREIIR